MNSTSVHICVIQWQTAERSFEYWLAASLKKFVREERIVHLCMFLGLGPDDDPSEFFTICDSGNPEAGEKVLTYEDFIRREVVLTNGHVRKKIKCLKDKKSKKVLNMKEHLKIEYKTEKIKVLKQKFQDEEENAGEEGNLGDDEYDPNQVVQMEEMKKKPRKNSKKRGRPSNFAKHQRKRKRQKLSESMLDENVTEFKMNLEESIETKNETRVKQILTDLKKYDISIEQMYHSKIGKIVNGLRYHSNEEIKSTTRSLVTEWKETVREQLRNFR